VTRAIRAAVAAGVDVARVRVEIIKDGRIIVSIAAEAAAAQDFHAVRYLDGETWFALGSRA
jgi:hypothetical protein